jgi:thiamine biosynthesis protein ThiS
MITITLNGKPRTLQPPLNVVSLLAALAVRPEQVAVAVNGEVVRREEWAAAAIGEGDAVEIVRAVGGGANATKAGKEPMAMDALLLLLTFAAGAAAATQVLVNGSISSDRGAPEALMVSVTVTYGAVVLFMAGRYLAGGGLNLRIPTDPLLYLLPLVILVVLAFVGLMRGFEWYHFLGGLAGALIVWTVAVAGPRIGIAATSAALISGQMTGAVIYDHLGLLEQAKDPVDALRVLGVILIVGGVFLVRGF